MLKSGAGLGAMDRAPFRELPYAFSNWHPTLALRVIMKGLDTAAQAASRLIAFNQEAPRTPGNFLLISRTLSTLSLVRICAPVQISPAGNIPYLAY